MTGIRNSEQFMSKPWERNSALSQLVGDDEFFNLLGVKQREPMLCKKLDANALR